MTNDILINNEVYIHLKELFHINPKNIIPVK